jgi:hypothetical protein
MDIHFVLRMPKFPVIVVSGNKLFCALSAQEAADVVAAEVFFEAINPPYVLVMASSSSDRSLPMKRDVL